ncbi:1-phosphofructokinase [Salipaludibacillus agaradhaerens]|uniref:Tagatose-6-phosphate kinase n=1 Tax=Salipaludibacillus agaradhaerens TaxID=76935 RepID=A0A9Q4FY57_SALAG|nr:1-phosphofructokinase [Salipaludibacillus agaradhaerens]MCR6095389.1 1-phosphofructokinase [Salipaludibacillus agaradhaerens]MCR6115053.1 1-phosphofructokinase [Salipaludibacillus agaradhaerens]
MIYTVTINPSIDYLVNVDNFQLGETNRVATQNMVPGGKGINVSKVLKNFGTASVALGFTAGFTGQYLKQELIKDGVDCQFIDTPGHTRINVKLKTDTATETEINGVAPDIKQEHIDQLFQQLDKLQKGDLLVLSGSLPTVLEADLYMQLIDHAKKKQAHVLADTSGEPLRHVLKASPFLIKPNEKELQYLYEGQITDLDSAIEFAQKAIEDGAEHVLVSMADKGAALVSQTQVYTATVPKGTVKNSVGAGDSMVAGFIYAYSQSRDLQEAFRFSVAAGSATAFSDGMCTEEKVKSLLSHISIKTRKKG